MTTRFGGVTLLPAALVLCLAAANPALGQHRTTLPAAGVELELEGSVERAFTSDERFDDTRLLEVRLRSVALRDARTPIQQLRIPAPGEVMFIVVTNAGDSLPSQPTRAGAFPRRSPQGSPSG